MLHFTFFPWYLCYCWSGDRKWTLNCLNCLTNLFYESILTLNRWDVYGVLWLIVWLVFFHVLLLVVYPFLKNRFVHLLLEFYWLLWELWHSSLTKERGLSEREVIFILNETGYWLVACLLSFIFYRVLEGTGKELNMSGTGEKTYKVLWLVRDLI